MTEPNESNPFTDADGRFGGVDPQGSLWVVIPKAAKLLLTTAFLLTVIFFLGLGHLPWGAVYFIVGILVFECLIIAGLRFRNRQDISMRPYVKPNRFLDMVGALWLVFCVFGAVFGFAAASFADEFPGAAVHLHWVTVILTIVLPTLTVLPNLRYLQGRSTLIYLPVFLVVNILTALLGLGSLRFLWNAGL